MRTLNLILLLFSFALVAQENDLSETEIEQFQEEVLFKANDLESLQADFVQTKHMKMMDDETESRGRVYFKAPQVLKWEYSEPYDYKVLFKEGQLHIDDEGQKSTENTSSNGLFEKLGKLVSGTVNGKLLEDAHNFDITYYREGAGTWARVKPKDQKLSRIFSEILLEFDSEKVIKSVKLQEDSGDYTLIQFENVRINQHIDELVFEQ